MIHHATTDSAMRMNSTARTAPVAFITSEKTSSDWPGAAAAFPTVTQSAWVGIGGLVTRTREAVNEAAGARAPSERGFARGAVRRGLTGRAGSIRLAPCARAIGWR